MTKKWLNRGGAPTCVDWFNVMHEMFVMENLTFALRLKIDIFDKCQKDELI